VILRSLLAVATCTACLPAAALLTRADRDDAEYLELATRYASSIRLPASAGEGVLVGSRWVLTAATPAELLREVKPTPEIAIGGRPYGIESIHTDGVIALIYLSRDVRGVLPIKVHRGPDQAGKVLAIVAHGQTGKLGGAASGLADGKRRAGINTVEAVAEKTFSVRVKAGDAASDLQGALAPGEIGAGAYLSDDEGDLYLAGIAQSTEAGTEMFVRLSQRFGWIEATMLAAAVREAEKLLGSDPN
jgi:hypothetical protein